MRRKLIWGIGALLIIVAFLPDGETFAPDRTSTDNTPGANTSSEPRPKAPYRPPPPSQMVEPDKAAVLTPSTAAVKSPSIPRVDPSANTTPMTVTGSGVRLRSGPNTQSNILGKAGRGMTVQVIGTEGRWAKLAHPLGDQVWIHRDYLATPKAYQALQTSARTTAAPSVPNPNVIRDALIQRSIAHYPGNCPCPYNRDRAGRKCGKRSAYSRPGGHSPLCYRSDVTEAMVRRATR